MLACCRAKCQSFRVATDDPHTTHRAPSVGPFVFVEQVRAIASTTALFELPHVSLTA